MPVLAIASLDDAGARNGPDRTNKRHWNPAQSKVGHSVEDLLVPRVFASDYPQCFRRAYAVDFTPCRTCPISKR